MIRGSRTTAKGQILPKTVGEMTVDQTYAGIEPGDHCVCGGVAADHRVKMLHGGRRVQRCLSCRHCQAFRHRDVRDESFR